MELSVDVAADGDRAADRLNIRFILEYFLGLARSENWGTF